MPGNPETNVALFVTKFDFPATLSVFSHMDSHAATMVGEFPDWERNPNWIELRAKEATKKFKIAHNHCAFESQWPASLNDDMTLGIRAVSQAVQKFSISTLTRVGSLIVLAIPEDIEYPDLVMRFNRKVHKPFNEIPAFGQHSLVDMNYAVSLRASQGDQWERNVMFCPMTRDQWFTFHPLRVRLKDAESAAINELKSKVPEKFSYINIDSFTTNIARNTAASQIEEVTNNSLAMARSLHEYLQE